MIIKSVSFFCHELAFLLGLLSFSAKLNKGQNKIFSLFIYVYIYVFVYILWSWTEKRVMHASQTLYP